MQQQANRTNMLVVMFPDLPPVPNTSTSQQDQELTASNSQQDPPTRPNGGS